MEISVGAWSEPRKDCWQPVRRPGPKKWEGRPGTVYLLHFDRPFTVNGVTLVQHYLGWTVDLRGRLREHAAGRGSFVTRKAHAQGVGFQVIRTWPGTLDTERELRQLGPKHLCPVCGWPRSADWPRRC